jgi:hypothetical protein
MDQNRPDSSWRGIVEKAMTLCFPQEQGNFRPAKQLSIYHKRPCVVELAKETICYNDKDVQKNRRFR